jgi:hypothetical protein
LACRFKGLSISKIPIAFEMPKSAIDGPECPYV